MSVNLYLVRHAISEGNLDSQKYFEKNDWDIDLAEEGKVQAEELGDKISELAGWSNLAISSTFKRALETRKIALGNDHDFKLMENPLAVERRWGKLRELVADKNTRKKEYFQFYYRPEGGESFFDCYNRIVLFFNDLRTNPIYEGYTDIFIFSHGEWIRLALMYLDGQNVRDFEKNGHRPKNCEVFKRSFKRII